MRGPHPSPLVMVTERLRVMVPWPDLAPAMVSFLERNREHFAPFDPPRPAGLYTESYWRERFDVSIQEYLEGRSMRLVFTLRDDPSGGILGDANFSHIIRGPFQACLLGYKLDEAAVGRGYMREALARAIRHAFEELRLHRVMANHLPENVRSAKVLASLGFVVEGYAKDYLFINGRWRDHVLNALTHRALAAPEVG